METNVKNEEQKPETKEDGYSSEAHLIYGQMEDPCWDYSHHLLPPISASATYRLDSARRGAQGFAEFAHSSAEVTVKSKAPIYIYDRLGEPNKDMLEENLAFAEGGDVAVSFASGMAAVSGVLGILTGAGSEILAHKTLYGCTYSLLTNWYPRQKINVKFVDFIDINEVRRSITPATRVLYLETPVNPTLRLIDLRAVAALAASINRTRSQEDRIYTVVDSTFASPFCQRPITLGIDFVVHSLTKATGGFGTGGSTPVCHQIIETAFAPQTTLATQPAVDQVDADLLAVGRGTGGGGRGRGCPRPR